MGVAGVRAPVRRVVGLASALLLLATACEGDSGPRLPVRDPVATATAADTRVIGLVGTLSGAASWRGEDAFEGADAAVNFVNRALSNGERRFELVSLDDEGDAQRAADLVEALAGSERTMGVIYAGPPQALPRAEDALARAGIPAILLYGDLYSAGGLSDHLFQSGPAYAWEARRLADYLLEDRGYRRIGVLTEASPDGGTARASLQVELRRAGARRAVAATYRTPQPLLRGPLARLRAKRVEAVVVHGGPASTTAVLEALDDMDAGFRGTAEARTASARPGIRSRLLRARTWHPQVAAFDQGVASEAGRVAPAGTVGADGYERGAHFLPVPSLRAFHEQFVDWWDEQPFGWERRSFEAVRMIAWASAQAGDEDVADVLETMEGKRLGGLPITLGPGDHAVAGEDAVGLWVVPAATSVPGSMPWLPLARTFSTDGRRTTVLPGDWRYLFRNPPRRGARPPPPSRMRFADTSGPSNPEY